MLLQKEIDELTTMLDHLDNTAPSVSKVGIAWHLDHSLKVILTVIDAVKDSDPSTYKWQFSFWRILLMPMGWFPRGRARAPRRVRPGDVITREGLVEQLELVKSGLKELEKLDPNAYFKHPYFGNLNMEQTPRFLALHTRHHLKIMREILEKAGS